MSDPDPPEDGDDTDIDTTQAHQAINGLSLAIVRLLEDAHPEAVLDFLRAPDGRTERFAQLGADVVALAAAIEVFERRTGVKTRYEREP